jgi:glyoxylase-like metal-dependent hydrolase (beta-lactamase superfamily II)
VLTAKRPGLSRDLPPGREKWTCVANSSTLVSGKRDGVLVDTFSNHRAIAVVARLGGRERQNLIAFYITHGHGDHFFGLAPLLARFPLAKAVAIPGVVRAMETQISPAFVDGFWRKRIPGQIPDRLLVAAPLAKNELELEGQKLVAVNTGRTDTAYSTSLHVPSIGLIVAGDVVYNGIHPYLVETDTQSRLEWIAALDKLEALKPRAVIAGHKIPENDDDPRNIAETRQYLRDFNRLDEATTTARQLYDAMLKLYPDRANPGSLWSGANAAKKQA